MTTIPAGGDSLRERIAERLPDLSPAERRVAEYLRDNAQNAVFATAGQIGAATGTSDATVVRTAKALGYSGLPALKRGLGQHIVEAQAQAPAPARRPPGDGDADEETDALLDHVLTRAADRLAETRRLVRGDDFRHAVDLLHDAVTISAFGVGPSELAARFLALRLTRLGARARCAGLTGFRLADELLQLRKGDVVVLYAPSRLSNDTVVLLDHARSVGAETVLVSDSLGPTLRERVTVVLPAVQSASGFTGELYGALLITDCLALALAARDNDLAAETTALLDSLRTELAPDPPTRRHAHREP
jgi:DNA-binding MurR/RpiR family transcriptional regulator